MVWQDRPLFGAAIQEAWNFAASDLNVQEEKQDLFGLVAWASVLMAAAQEDSDN